MAYKHTNSKGVEYILHYKDVILRGGRVVTLARRARAVGLRSLPTPCVSALASATVWGVEGWRR